MEGNGTIDVEQTLAANAYEEDDVEMLDAETLNCGAVVFPPRNSFPTSADGGSGRTVDGGQGEKNKRRRNRNRNRKKNRAANPSNIADINSFFFLLSM
jgi:hypothetical protein